MLRSLEPLWRVWCLVYYRAALRSMQKQGKATHADVPEIILSIKRYER